jgi:alkanesulfonate monooxygenase SsuD/methylene tetrahydromethanopterin reductase-like flavin-dependent oxidoreductase (luciferase family)
VPYHSRHCQLHGVRGILSTSLKFGTGLRSFGRIGYGPAEAAQFAERLGFDLFTVNDHLHSLDANLDTWTMLTLVASNTRTIAFAPAVLGLYYRHPAVIAKGAASLDRLSNGRFVLGLGAGNTPEYDAFGIAYGTPGERLEAVREAIAINRRLWAEPKINFDGKHYQLHEANIEPRPERAIPIWVGFYGPRALRLTGELADGWIPSLPARPFEAFVQMRDDVRRAAERAGRNPDDVICACNVTVQIKDGAQSRQGTVAGSRDQVIEGLQRIIDAGFTYPVVGVQGDDVLEQFELFAREVMPVLRRQGAPA